MHPDEVALYFVDEINDGPGSIVKPIALNDRGTPDWWPKGVFAENQAEFYAIRQELANKVEDSFLRRWLVVDGRGGSGEVLNSLRGRAANDRFFVFIDSDRSAKGGHRARQRKQSNASVSACRGFLAGLHGSGRSRTIFRARS